MAREYYLDRIRVVLTALVVFHHAAITYGAPGGWYYQEIPAKISLGNLPFVLFVSVNQAYFMGAFFLIAGYFTPRSYDRKGARRFLADRAVRLGIPWMGFYLFLNPLCDAFVDAGTRGLPFWRNYRRGVLGGAWGNGPLWFAEALLLFSLAYAAWRRLRRFERVGETPVPPPIAWWASALGVGAVALILRQFVPVGRNFLGLQLGYFASYAFLFGLGTVAWRRNWLSRLNFATAWPWLTASIVLLPALVLTALWATRGGKPLEVDTGFSLPAIVYAFWEPLVAWGMLATLVVGFRELGNRPSRIWEWLAASAYGVYCIHAPVLVGVALSFRGWPAAAAVKWAVTGTIAVGVSLAISAVLVRLPGVRRVL